MKIAPHALKAMLEERDSHIYAAKRLKANSIERFQAEERVNQLNVQIKRIQEPEETRKQPEPFRATGIPGGDAKAYGEE